MYVHQVSCLFQVIESRMKELIVAWFCVYGMSARDGIVMHQDSPVFFCKSYVILNLVDLGTHLSRKFYAILILMNCTNGNERLCALNIVEHMTNHPLQMNS